MKRVKNADIKIKLSDFKGIIPYFRIKFYTTNSEYSIEKTVVDLVWDESDEDVEYIKLNWTELQTIGRGVMNYRLMTYQNDTDFDDGVYDHSYTRTTEYFIDTDVIIDDEDPDKTVSELIAEVDEKVDEEIARSTEKDAEHDEAIANLQDEIDNIDIDLTGYATESWVQEQGYLTTTDVSNKQDKLTSGWVSKIVDEQAGSSGTLHKLQLVNDLNQNIDVIATSQDPHSSWNQGDDQSLATIALVKSKINEKQDTLVSGTNIKTINRTPLLGSGNIDIATPVQSDWNETNMQSLAYILHKPTIPTVPTNVSAFTNDAGYLTEHQDLSDYATESWVQQQEYAQSSNLSTVATSGSYNDLSNKPTIPTVPTNVSAFTNDAGYLTQHQDLSGYQPKLTAGTNITIDANNVISSTGGGGGVAQVQSDWNQSDNTAVDYIKNKPTIPTVPTNVSAFTNDAGYLTQHQDISGKANTADLATVATSGSYNDLSNKPTIPSLSGYATESWVQQQGYAQSSNLSTVATSGSYNDLSNKPTIPTVPTNVSSFTNDAGYLTQSSLSGYATQTWVQNQGYVDSSDLSSYATQSDIADMATQTDLADYQPLLTAGTGITINNNVISATGGGGVAQVQTDWNQTDTTAVDYIKNKPTIPTVPTNVSAFTNDAGYLTSHQSLSGYATETWVSTNYYNKTYIDTTIGNIETLLSQI